MPKDYKDHIHHPDLYKMPMRELLSLAKHAKELSKYKRTDRDKAVIRVANRRNHWQYRGEGPAPLDPKDNRHAGKDYKQRLKEDRDAEERGVIQGKLLVQEILEEQRRLADQTPLAKMELRRTQYTNPRT